MVSAGEHGNDAVNQLRLALLQDIAHHFPVRLKSSGANALSIKHQVYWHSRN